MLYKTYYVLHCIVVYCYFVDLHLLPKIVRGELECSKT